MKQTVKSRAFRQPGTDQGVFLRLLRQNLAVQAVDLVSATDSCTVRFQPLRRREGKAGEEWEAAAEVEW